MNDELHSVAAKNAQRNGQRTLLGRKLYPT